MVVEREAHLFSAMPGWRLVAIGALVIITTMCGCTSATDAQTEPPASTKNAPFESTPSPAPGTTVISGSTADDGGSALSDPDINDLLFEQAIGTPLDQVDRRVLAARSAKVAECLAGRGFRPTLGARDQAFNETPPPYDGYADYMIRRIDAERAAGIVPGPEFSSDEINALIECDQAATDSVPDPIAVYAAWLDTVSSEIAGRVESDPRAVEAMRRFDECLAESGYDSSTPDPLVDLAIDIHTKYDNGEISYEAAVGQLRALSQSESPQIKAASKCDASYDSVADQVFSEYRNAYLDENAALLTELRQSIEVALKQLDGVQPS